MSREITAHGWTAQDAVRAERMRTERAGTDPVAEAELHRIQWEEVEGMGQSWEEIVERQVAEEQAFFKSQGLTHPTPEREP